MTRCKFVLAGLLMCGLLIGWGMTQAQPGDLKDPKAQPAKQPAEIDTYKDDIKIIQQAGMKGDGAELLAYFKERTLKQPDPKAISALVKQLGDEDFATREKAFTALVTMGASALAGLKEGETDPDLEVKKRVADLRSRIDTNALPILHAAMARVVGKLKPEGAAEVLLAYVPFASDTLVVDDICRALGSVALRDGKVEPILVKSLEDAIAAKRGAAGEALARAGVKEQMPNVKKLLADKDVSVRYRVCMAMMAAQDKDIVPVMIDLMGELDANQLWPIEAGLHQLAGDKAPNIGLGSDPASRKLCRDAWSKWYAANEKTIDITKLSGGNVFLGFTLIVQHNNRIGVGGGGNTGEVFELDKDKNVRWKISLPTGYPVDAQVVGAGRVLIAEYQANKVTERDLKGEVKWEYNCGGNPFAVQRLPNGNTFIAMTGRLIEINREKKEVWSYQRPNNDIVRARKLPGGDVCYISNLGVNATFVRMDKDQKVLKQFNVTAVQMLFGSMEVLPNGNIIVPHYNNQRVVEYNQDGGQVGNPIQLAWPNSVSRLPNGNNLVTSYQQRQVYEFNANQQQVWNYQADGPVFVARRR